MTRPTPGRALSAVAAIGLGLGMLSTACGGTANSANSSGPPPCSIGQGTNGETSTLRLKLNGEAVSGTDVVTGSSGVTARYMVNGTASNGNLAGDWVFGSQTVQVTGTYTGTKVRLEDPSGSLGATDFTAAHC